LKFRFDTQIPKHTKIGGNLVLIMIKKKESYYIISMIDRFFNEARYYTTTIALENDYEKCHVSKCKITSKKTKPKVLLGWNTANTSADQRHPI
jgi:hypothetical protein